MRGDINLFGWFVRR